jgi:hypothetical protein
MKDGLRSVHERPRPLAWFELAVSTLFAVNLSWCFTAPGIAFLILLASFGIAYVLTVA